MAACDEADEADADQPLTLCRVPFGNPTNLLTLPRDLLEQILRRLNAQDVKTCSLISRKFNMIIRSSIFLQYRIACHAAGVVDDPRCKLAYAERYEALLKRERAWRRFQPVFTKTLDVSNESPKRLVLQNVNAGLYLIGDFDHRNLHYCTLPSTPEDVPRWAVIHGHGPKKDWNGQFANVGMAICEHDLIVNVLAIPNDTEENRVDLYMIPLQFSTGEYHPLARYPPIYIEEFDETYPSVAVEIVGDNIALMTRTSLFIFDWKTGRRRMQYERPTGSRVSLDFVSPDTLIVPNVNQARFEIWKIPKEADQIPYRSLTLHLPAVSEGLFIFDIRCHEKAHAYPVHDLLHAPPRPFHSSIDDTIIMIMVRFAPMQGNLLSGSIFALFIHRKSLLDTITKLLDADESRVKAPASGSRRRGTLSVPWSKWGPPISMWLDIDRGNSIFWTDPPAGQRWAFLSFTGRNRLTVFDFNPYNIHHAQEDLPGQYAKSRKGDLFSHRNIFAEDIEMGLGCTMYTLPDAYDFHGLLIDEERLMGFKMDDSGIVTKVTVFYFG